jgi:hypothetical protein
LAQALIRIVGDDALRATLRVRGLERATLFNWDAAARAHLAVYHAAGA